MIVSGWGLMCTQQHNFQPRRQYVLEERSSRHSPGINSTSAKKVPSPLSKGDKKSTTGKKHDCKHASARAGHHQEGTGNETDGANPPGQTGSSIHTI